MGFVVGVEFSAGDEEEQINKQINKQKQKQLAFAFFFSLSLQLTKLTTKTIEIREREQNSPELGSFPELGPPDVLDFLTHKSSEQRTFVPLILER